MKSHPKSRGKTPPLVAMPVMDIGPVGVPVGQWLVLMVVNGFVVVTRSMFVLMMFIMVVAVGFVGKMQGTNWLPRAESRTTEKSTGSSR